MWQMVPFALFLFLSLADLTITLMLMSEYGNIEDNPLASFIYEKGGRVALAAYKGTLVLVVVKIAAYIIKKQKRFLGNMVLGFGCLAVGITVGYSLLIIAECSKYDRSIQNHQLQFKPPPPGRDVNILGHGSR